MQVPAEILAAVRTHLDCEIQAGRRRQPIDRAVAEGFLAGSAARGAKSGGKLHAESAESAEGAKKLHAEFAESAEAAEKPHAEFAESAEKPHAEFAETAELAKGEIRSPEEAAAAARDVAEVAAAVGACRLCALAATRTKSVPGVGNADSPEIMFVGEAPGRDEDLRGEPFVGRAGQLLDKMIAAMGFSRGEVFIANVLKCRPPDNRTPTPEEMARCLPYLRRQIALVRPKTIVALGATAYRGLVGDSTAGISSIRGLWQSFDGIPLMPTFHPAYLLRAPAAKRVVWEDLKKVLSRLGRVPPSSKNSQ